MAHTIQVDSETFLRMFNREDDFDIDDYQSIKENYKENDILIVEEVKSGRFFTSKLQSIEIQYPGYSDFLTDSVYHLINISNIGC